MNARKQLTQLLKRDDHLCGIHIGGCGQEIKNRTDATVDHIFTRSFFKDREIGIEPRVYNRDWNCQPMHPECNRQRGGQIYGFPLFSCSCHWLQTERKAKGNHVLTLHYRTESGEIALPVSTEKDDFVFRPQLSTGKSSHLFGDRKYIDVDISGMWSMGTLKPGKKGITGKGQLGHVFPRISPEEVQEFNRLEVQRIKGVSTPQTLEKFNSRMDAMSIQVHFEVVE